jgi:hypothetical protein
MLLLNTFQRLRLQAMLAEADQIFYCKLMLAKLRNCNTPNLNELFKFAGNKIWLLYSNRLKNSSLLLSQMLHSYAQMLSLNEKSRESWLTGLLVIHCHLIFLDLQKLMDITYGIMVSNMCPNSFWRMLL